MNRITKLLFTILSLVSIASAQKIALTFDDAPIRDGAYYSGIERTKTLIEKLKKSGVPQAAFFCITSNMDSLGAARIQQYAVAEHIVANHTHSHISMRQLGIKNYIQDIFKADEILCKQPGFQAWFRFPFLDEGRTREDRDAIRQALAERGYTNGYVTVDNYDWYIDRLFQAALREKKKIDCNKLRRIYLDHLWRSIAFYEQMARAVLGRSPKHVLLLHENDLAALYVDELVALLRKKGWKIISPAEAYTDPIAKTVPDVLLNNQGRIAAIAKANGYKGLLGQESEDEAFLEKLFQTSGVILENK
jgi:peptidoglycan/xylan/chitin deacetylase (PgdA/CDA1 family)